MIGANRWRAIEIVALVLILALASFLRLSNRADNPGWYSDEGTHLNIAQNLLLGRIQYLALNQSTLLVSRLPLFEVTLAALLGLWGGGMGTLRALTGVLGVISTGALYALVRRTHGEPWLALLSALMYAIYPLAVVSSRFGFSYNLLTPLVLLVVWGLWEYLGAVPPSNTRRAWLAMAALAIGIGGVSDLWMFVLLAPLALVVSARNWRDLVWSLLLTGLPFSLYVAIMLACAPQALWFDVSFILFRVTRLAPWDQLINLALNYTVLVSRDHWTALALVGLLMLRPARLQRLSLLVSLLPIVILGRTVALRSLSFYYLIPLLPFVGLGMASAIRYGVPFAWRIIREALYALFARWRWRSEAGLNAVASLILLFIVVTPSLTTIVWTAQQVTGVFNTEIDPFLVNPAHAREAAEFVNRRTTTSDVVIASPALAWLLQAQVADVEMSIAITGQGTPNLPTGIPRDRFAFDARYTQAHFVVVDNLWRNWAMWNVAGAADVLRDVTGWPLAFKVGEIEVYCNPAQDC